MDITKVDKEYFEKKKNECQSRKNSISFDRESFEVGWDSAIRLAKKIAKGKAFCSQCGKILMPDDMCADAEFNMFCRKCYRKIFTNENLKKGK